MYMKLKLLLVETVRTAITLIDAPFDDSEWRWIV